MAYTKKSWQDHFLASFGQESETTPSGNSTGLVVGGVYNSSAPTLSAGEFGRLQMDASGNLMVNLVSGDAVTVSVGTITTGSLTDVAKLYTGTIQQANVTVGTFTPQISVGTIPSLASYYTGTVTLASTKTSGTLTSVINGNIKYITQTTPDLNGTGTATVRVVDAQGGTTFSGAAQDESTTTLVGSALSLPVTTSHKFVVTADGTQADSADIVLGITYNSI